MTRESNNKNQPRDEGAWIPAEGSLRRRQYDSYEEYVAHQKAKLGQIDLSQYHEQFRDALRERLKHLGILTQGETVLCLGARLGTECLAFHALGCFAVGIDLNPGQNNHYVLQGDFHALQFPDGSVGCVFTNALDHGFDLQQVVSEVKRVLRHRGVFIAEIVRGSKDMDGRDPGTFESYWWDSVEDVIKKIESTGFTVERRYRFTYPWGGDQIVFRSAEKD